MEDVLGFEEERMGGVVVGRVGVIGGKGNVGLRSVVYKMSG